MRITEDLIHKKTEHHDGLLADLEEITLHQLEIERIEVIGTLCRKLQILYLQNNIISRIEGLHHCKELRYLNLALNNVAAIEGLSSCEFLTKLDLTVNFIDMDAFEASIDHLRPLLHLRELFLMGNPCEHAWPGCRAYVAATLPQLKTLDGKEITRSERITAQQDWRALRADLRARAAVVREEKGLPPAPPPPREDPDDDTEPWCPETRTKMYREMAEQKEEQDRRKRANEPSKRDYAAEHAARKDAVRAAESVGVIRQTNEGRFDFVLEDEVGSANIVLRLSLSRFLDSSLIDVDVHPLYVSVLVKTKAFRILWPEEVRSSDGTCQRSTTTGELAITVPRVRARAGDSAAAHAADVTIARTARWAKARGETGAAAAQAAGRVRRLGPAEKGSAGALADALAAECGGVRGAVSLTGLVRGGAAREGLGAGYIGDGMGGTALFRAAETTKGTSGSGASGQEFVGGGGQVGSGGAAAGDDSGVPPLEDA